MTSPESANEVNDFISSSVNYQPNANTLNNTFTFNDKYVPNKEYMHKYFSNLTNNYPYNDIGLCGYTAISMLISFYDTYWNDNFIDELYDMPTTMLSSSYNNNSKHLSPGVFDFRREMKWDTEEGQLKKLFTEGTDEYKSQLDRWYTAMIDLEISRNSFFGQLIQIAIHEGIIVTHRDNNDAYFDGFGVNNHIMNSVLQRYIADNNSLNGNVSIVTSEVDFTNINTEEGKAPERQRIRNEVVELLKAGKPVLLGGNGFDDRNKNGVHDEGENEGGHLVIAYEYDEINDIIYGHTGWDGKEFWSIDEVFNIGFSDYWALEIEAGLPQSFTNNYYFSDLNRYYSPNTNVTRPKN